MENLFWIGFIGAFLALGFAYVQARKVLSFSEGTPAMIKIADAIRKGANAYLNRQYRAVALIFVIIAVILAVLAYVPWLGENGGLVNKFVPFAFLTGGMYSSLAGFIGMKIATAANSRTANAAAHSLNRGLGVAISSGSVMGFTVVGLGILDVTLWFHILKYVFHADATTIANTMVMFGMGASCAALFARVGGGIFTKAADVGADLVGKVEAGIPEDDPRNPATIADNVGDNVGDVAGMGADLYESYIGSILATFAIGAVAGYGWNGMLLPLAIAAVGVLCSLVGTFMIRTGEEASQRELLKSMRTGTGFAAVSCAVLCVPITWWIMSGVEGASWFGILISIYSGLVAGVAIGYVTEYYTSDTYKPTQEIAAASETGLRHRYYRRNFPGHEVHCLADTHCVCKHSRKLYCSRWYSCDGLCRVYAQLLQRSLWNRHFRHRYAGHLGYHACNRRLRPCCRQCRRHCRNERTWRRGSRAHRRS